MTTRMISKPDWRPYLDQVSKTLVGRRAEIDVLSLKLGSQVQARGFGCSASPTILRMTCSKSRWKVSTT